jgi:hypothetical protein
MVGIQTWKGAKNHLMNPDRVNDLGIGHAYFRYEWELEINPFWLPLTSLLLIYVNLIFKPGIS